MKRLTGLDTVSLAQGQKRLLATGKLASVMPIHLRRCNALGERIAVALFVLMVLHKLLRGKMLMSRDIDYEEGQSKSCQAELDPVAREHVDNPDIDTIVGPTEERS